MTGDMDAGPLDVAATERAEAGAPRRFPTVLWHSLMVPLLLLLFTGAVSGQKPEVIPETVDRARLPEMTPATIFTRDGESLKMVDVERREVIGYIDVSLSGYRPVVLPYRDEVFAYATERFHTRGTRGEVITLVSVFGYDGDVSAEVEFPQPQMVSVDISSDGGNLYYYNAVDETIWRIDLERSSLDEPVYVGATCGADVFAVGSSKAFTTCWNRGELVEIDYSGSEPEVTRHRVFSAGAELYRIHARWRGGGGGDGTRVFLFTRDSEVIPIRFDEEGVPLEADPVSLHRDGEIIAPRGEAYAISPDGERAFVSYRDGTEYKSDGERVRVFDTSTWEELMEITAPDEISALAVTLDGRWLVTAGEDRLSIFDAETYHFRGFFDDVSPRGVYVPVRLNR